MTKTRRCNCCLKVKEKGKNSIGLNGGVSGLSGAFLGLNYQTNNFLGLGETLSVQASIGSISRNLLFGFTEPYLRNRPLSVGFQVYSNKTDYNASKNYKQTTGQSLNASAATASLLQNYNQATTGLSFSASYPDPPLLQAGRLHLHAEPVERHHVQRRLQQSLPDPGLPQRHPGAERARRHHQQHGVVQLSRKQASTTPTSRATASELSAAFQIAGIWGNVRYISPVVEFKQFHPVQGFRFTPTGRNVFGYKLQRPTSRASAATVAPPFNRFYRAASRNSVASTFVLPRPTVMFRPGCCSL